MIAAKDSVNPGPPSARSKIALGYAIVVGIVAAVAIVAVTVQTSEWQNSLDTKYAYCRAQAPLALGKGCSLGSSTDAAILLWMLFAVAVGCIGIFAHQISLEVLPSKREQARRRSHYHLVFAALMVPLVVLFVWLESLVALHL